MMILTTAFFVVAFLLVSFVLIGSVVGLLWSVNAIAQFLTHRKAVAMITRSKPSSGLSAFLH